MAAHVLVVDDNPSNLKLACDVLESAGYQVERASSAEAALASIARSKPALILLDIALPGMDGLELTRRLKAEPGTEQIVAVAMTAFAMKGDEDRIRAAGCDGYIAKPIDTRALPQQVADYLAGNVAELPKQILIVEDVPTNRKLLRITLESEGFTVFEAADGVEALRILQQMPVEAVISDVLMPNMDGYRLCYEIRSNERWFRLPVIIYTNTYTSAGDERVALELGADRYLRKPAPAGVIVQALREAVTSSSRHTHARIRQPEGLELLKSYSSRLVAKLEERNLELSDRTEALTESNRLFSELTGHLPEIFWLASVDRQQVFYVSPAYEAVFGCSCRSLVERPESWLERVHPEDHERVQEAIRGAAQGGGYDQQYRIVRPNGQIAWLEERAFPIRDAEGNKTRLAGLADDVTERRAARENQERLQAELRQAQKLEALGALAAGIAHDFNNLVTAILGNSELACVSLATDHPAYEHIVRVIHASQRAVDLIRQIFSFSRRQDPTREPIELTPVIVEVVKLLRGSLPANIGIRAALPDHVPMVVANASQVHQVLMNLCTNAAHAMAERGGLIEIRAELVVLEAEACAKLPPLESGSYLRIAVSDTGHGMDAATLERVFQPFFTTKRAGHGTGLGLSVVQGIMHDHQGAVIVESKVGHGSTFRLLFPVWTGAVPEVSPSKAPLPIAQGERLMMVSDADSMTALAAKSLETLGYRVSAFTRPDAALASFRADPRAFDLVISDLHTSESSGLELAKELRAVRADIPIVLAAGALNVSEAQKLNELGVREVLTKPFSLDVLSASVRQALLEAAERPHDCGVARRGALATLARHGC